MLYILRALGKGTQNIFVLAGAVRLQSSDVRHSRFLYKCEILKNFFFNYMQIMMLIVFKKIIFFTRPHLHRKDEEVRDGGRYEKHNFFEKRN